MRILVTGATGFVGYEFVKYASKNHSVVATYRKTPGQEMKNVRWVRADLTSTSDFDVNRIKKLGIEVDTIAHIGGASPNRAYADGNFDATTEGTKLIVDLGKNLGVKKIVFVSSISATMERPGPYGASKLVAEKLVIESGIEYTILRPVTIVGRGAIDFNKLCKMLSKAKVFPVIGKGIAAQQPIDVEDLAKIILICSENKKSTQNKTWSIAGKEKVKIEDFLKKIAKSKNNNIKLVNIPMSVAIMLGKMAEIINPRWGLNEERVLTQGANFDVQDKIHEILNTELKGIDEMLGYLRDEDGKI